MLSFVINIIQSSMWWWHNMPFSNKVSQIFMIIHNFSSHHKFLCVLNLWHQYLSWKAIFFVCHEIFEVMNSYACVCVLNNLLLTCNYDYNINSHFEKVTCNSLIFKLLNTVPYVNIPIKLTYVCRLFIKHLFWVYVTL